MAAVDVLGSADVAVVYGAVGAVADLTSTHPFASIRIAGGGANATLSPVGSPAPEVIPITAVTTITADGWAGDTLDRIALVDRRSAAVAVILAASDRGWIVPGGPLDIPGRDDRTAWPTTDVAQTQVTFDPSGAPLDVVAVVAVDSDANITVPPIPAGGAVWLALTTAGDLAGQTRKVGVHTAAGDGGGDITAGQKSVSGARGWLLVAVPHTPGGV